MKKLPKILIILAIFLTVAIVSFFNWSSLNSLYNRYFGKEIENNNDSDSPKFEVEEGYVIVDSFPKDVNYVTEDNKWGLSALNGMVKEYGEEKGVKYVVVQYFVKDQDKEVKILLNIDKAIADPIYKDLDFDARTIKKFNNRYVNTIYLYETIKDQSQQLGYQKLSFDEISKRFVPGDSLSFLLLSNFPQKSERDVDNCAQTTGAEYCFISKLTDIYSPDVLKLWQGQNIDTKSVLIPFGIYSQFIESNNE